MIKRDYYLKQIEDRMWNGLVKVITGIRRCGKSYLLMKLFKQYLLDSGVSEDRIVQIELDRRSFISLRDPDELCRYVYSRVNTTDRYYVFIDEVQMCDDFESVLNEFLHRENLDVYVTGSNSKLLSRDIATEFRGRGDEIHLYPLSFREFYQAYGDFDEAWKDYSVFGGMPLVLSRKDDVSKMTYLKDLFRETYMKDIIERNGIKNDTVLENLLNILASSIGSFTNPARLVNTFASVKKQSVSLNTIKAYIGILEDPFIIERSDRFDVKRKRYINTPSKYYFTDIGLRNARLNFRQQEETHIMENIIYNELRIRGYAVDVGTVEVSDRQADGRYVRKQLECDFVVNSGDTRFYIQSAYHIQDEEKEQQEKRPLLNIDDSFRKIIIVNENIRRKVDDHGIVTVSLKDFLLDDSALN